MEINKIARELGKAIQADERYLKMQKCIETNKADEGLNELMARIQLVQMSFQKEGEGEANEQKMQELEKEFNALYSEIMQNENMKNYEAARAEIDKMMNYVVELLALCVNGEDPDTCEPDVHECAHDHDCDCGCHDCH